MAKQYDDRFIVVHNKQIEIKGGYIEMARIIVDKLTGVQYLSNTVGASDSSLTVLVDQDGKPLLYQPHEE